MSKSNADKHSGIGVPHGLAQGPADTEAGGLAHTEEPDGGTGGEASCAVAGLVILGLSLVCLASIRHWRR